ncbi:MAG: hypothetical protein J1F35_06390 [Erysipelotrichales bacterium]|nr:hypothetical protein [Erysipelotrichales bacterium]
MKVNLNLLPYDLTQEYLKLGYDYEVLYEYEDESTARKLKNWTNDCKNPCPMAEHVCQWLREEKDLQLFPIRVGNATMPFLGYAFIIFSLNKANPEFTGEPYGTAEEAIIEGLKYIIKNYESYRDILDQTND